MLYGLPDERNRRLAEDALRKFWLVRVGGVELSVKSAVNYHTLRARGVDRGAFYQKTGGRWVYVLVGDREAERRSIRLGRCSSESCEVIEGLEPGDRVIVSNYDSFQDSRELILE